MNNDWVLGKTNIDLPTIEPEVDNPLVGDIELDKAEGNDEPGSYINLFDLPSEPPSLPKLPKRPKTPPVQKDNNPRKTADVKDWVIDNEDLDPLNRFMNWNKKHPKGQDAPMRRENKMISFERKNNK
jgi:hypothetical protein